jgi:hypothetical protein
VAIGYRTTYRFLDEKSVDYVRHVICFLAPQLRDELRVELGAELARHTKAANEETRRHIAAPARIERRCLNYLETFDEGARRHCGLLARA